MEQPVRILDGDLETLGLQATLKMLSLGGKTGILRVSSGSETLQIALKDGHIVALEESGVTQPDMIEVFRLLMHLTRQEATLLKQQADRNPANSLRVMVENKVIAPDIAQRYVEFAIIQPISRAIRWERGRFEFNHYAVPIQPHGAFVRPLSVDHILLEALRIADENAYAGPIRLSRQAVARWMPHFSGNVRELGLSQDEVNVLCLANGQFTLTAMSYALLLPEVTVAASIEKLLQLHLIELVDEHLEGELEQSLMALIMRSQYQLAQKGRVSTEQRMLTLVRAMGICINGLLTHHREFARTLRGRGQLPESEVNRYLEQRFGSVLTEMQLQCPRMDEIIRFEHGTLVYHEVEILDRVVKGQELLECYHDAVWLVYHFMYHLFSAIIEDETGSSRLGRQLEDLWKSFLDEIEGEMRPIISNHAALRA
ncbi:MAG TPA: DUF4388 domain-containing protein [Ktedonobacterales bacterium]